MSSGETTAVRSSRTIAVTGASGLIGRHLCEDFAAAGWSVRALLRSTSRYPFTRPGIPTFACDLPDLIDERGLEGADVVIHCAFATRATNEAEARRINEDGTRRLQEAARRAGVTRMLFISSTMARENGDFFSASQFRVEEMMDPLRDLVVRAGLVLSDRGGVLPSLASLARWLRVSPVVNGDAVIQTVHIDDLSRGLARAIVGRVAGLLAIAEPEGVSGSDFAEIIAETLGTRTVPVPADTVLMLLKTLEAVRLPAPLTSRALASMMQMKRDRTDADLARLGLQVRPTHVSVAELLRRPRAPMGEAAA